MIDYNKPIKDFVETQTFYKRHTKLKTCNGGLNGVVTYYISIIKNNETCELFYCIYTNTTNNVEYISKNLKQLTLEFVESGLFREILFDIQIDVAYVIDLETLVIEHLKREKIISNSLSDDYLTYMF